jgi:hypothetical protein
LTVSLERPQIGAHEVAGPTAVSAGFEREEWNRVRLWVVVMLLLSAREAAAQVTPPPEGTGNGRFGAPVLKVTSLRDQAAVM